MFACRRVFSHICAQVVYMAIRWCVSVILKVLKAEVWLSDDGGWEVAQRCFDAWMVRQILFARLGMFKKKKDLVTHEVSTDGLLVVVFLRININMDKKKTHSPAVSIF